MSDLQNPVALVCSQMLIYAVMWGAAWRIVRDEQHAILHWLVFSLSVNAGLVFFMLRPHGPLWLTEQGSNVALLIGFLAMRQGARLFIGLPAMRAELWLILGGGVFGLIAVGNSPQTLPGRVAVMAVAMAWVFLRMSRELYRPLLDQFGRRVALIGTVPLVMFGLANAVRLWVGITNGQSLVLQQSAGGNYVILHVGLITSGLFNLLFLFLVVLRLVGKLTFMAERDPLTGLLNRRVMQNLLQREWDRHRRQGVPFALVSVDVDHFKRINDRHGHPMGDEVLRSVADALQQQTRTIDSTARMGGEEFLLLLPGCDASGGQIAAQRLRQALKGLEFQPADGSTLNVTASFGVTTPVSGDQGVEVLLHRVDEALYVAKASGRDRVVVDVGPAADASPVPAPPVAAPPAEVTDRVPA